MKWAIGIAAIAFCVVALYVTIFSTPTAMVFGVPRLALLAMVGLGTFIFVGIVYVYSFKSKR